MSLNSRRNQAGRRLRHSALAVLFAAACGASLAQLPAAPAGTATVARAVVGPSLQDRLASATATDPVRVIVTFHGKGAPTAAQLEALRKVGVTGVHLNTFPIAGVTATPAQVRQIAALPNVRSVWLDEPLQYENDGATRLTGVQKLRADQALAATNGGLPYTGRGIGVLVNDSGIDATHADLQFPDHVVQNVYGTVNGVISIEPLTWVENVPNTDFSTSHGTHVAGILGGSGARSGGLYAGVAPGANIVGYGSGAAISVLDTLGAFDYANANAERYNIRVVTNSYGQTGQMTQPFNPNDPSSIVTQTLAEDRNMVIVFSAGNSGAGENTITGVFKKAPWVIVAANGTKDGRLAPSSSRGRFNFAGSYFDAGRGITYALTDRPTVTTPGTSIVAPRPVSADPLAAGATGVNLAPEHIPFYMVQSGTSMSAPHVAGIVALMLEANPALGWREVKAILEKTATNVADLGDWEVGAGYANAYAAVAMAAASKPGTTLAGQGYGATNKLTHGFNARALYRAGETRSFTITYLPANTGVAPDNFATFDVPPGTALLTATGNVGTGTGQLMRIALEDPDGVLYAPGVPIPGGATSGLRSVTARGKPGTWKVLVRGTCGLTSGEISVSVCADGLDINGLGAPTVVNVTVTSQVIDHFVGLSDIAAHPLRTTIEEAVANRLMDGQPDGAFHAESTLTRIELADFLALSPGLRQFLPLNGVPSFRDVPAAQVPFAEAAAAPGGMLLDADFGARAAMEIAGGKFQPDGPVRRLQLAYSLVQALGGEDTVAGFVGPVRYEHEGTVYEVSDLEGVPAGLLGYVQAAMDEGFIVPTVQVTRKKGVTTTAVLFKPKQAVTRAEFARATLLAAGAYRPR